MANLDFSDKTILVVDDDSIIALAMAENITREGYGVIQAHSGEEALRAVKLRPDGVDLILMDIELGDGMDGTEAAREILKTHDIPIVFLSSYTDRETVERTKKITSYGYVVKNTGIVVLIASIEMAFKLHEANRLLRISSDNFSMVFHASPNAMTISRAVDGMMLQVNDAYTELTGYTRDESVGRSALTDLHFWTDPGDRVRISAELETKGRVDGRECYFKMKKGSPRLVQLSISMTIYNNEKCFVIIARDLTERKLSENLLRESEERFSKAFRSSPAAMAITDIDTGLFIDVNEKWIRIIGHSREEMIGRTSRELGIFPDWAERERIVAMLRNKEYLREVPLRSVTKSGEMLDVLWSMEVIDLRGRKVLLSMIYDITKRKKAEQLLRESEERFLKAFRSSPASMMISDIKTGCFIDVNDQWVKLTGYTREEMIGYTTKDLKLFTDWGDREKVVDDLRRHGSVREAAIQAVTKSGDIRDLLWSVEIIKVAGNDYMLSLVYDITERKRIESALRDSLEEKTVLLQEVHHRVKNNMQLITSLLGLQANGVKDAEASAVLADSMQRIYSMAQIHERMYRSGNMASIDFFEYLRGLANEIVRSYIKEPDSINIAMDVGDVRLSLNKAVPCGLLVNEILTNAVKHGCKGPEPCNIELSFLTMENHYRLTVKDNGPGIPDSALVDNKKTLGMMLIQALGKQLNASITIERNIGTCYHITIPA
ncbi:MAG: PAS domain S-box protein [Spirochaetes bacterium]|nr:PAS domain S-box protein [Spirochaetota bacterium]